MKPSTPHEKQRVDLQSFRCQKPCNAGKKTPEYQVKASRHDSFASNRPSENQTLSSRF